MSITELLTTPSAGLPQCESNTPAQSNIPQQRDLAATRSDSDSDPKYRREAGLHQMLHRKVKLIRIVCIEVQAAADRKSTV